MLSKNSVAGIRALKEGRDSFVVTNTGVMRRRYPLFSWAMVPVRSTSARITGLIDGCVGSGPQRIDDVVFRKIVVERLVVGWRPCKICSKPHSELPKRAKQGSAPEGYLSHQYSENLKLLLDGASSALARDRFAEQSRQNAATEGK